jgi:hypothetical protein
MSVVVGIDAYLAWARLVGDETSGDWRSGEPENGAPTAAALRDRVRRAAEWTVATAPSRRVAWVVVDVADAACAWIKAPSAAEPVIAASLRGLTQEWGELAPMGAIEMLTPGLGTGGAGGGVLDRLRGRPSSEDAEAESAPHKPAALGPQGLAVLTLPDALTRLWLDELDRRGARVGAVLTLWHAMARVWGAEEGDGDAEQTVAVLLTTPGGRVVWAWARGDGSLIIGGEAALETTTDEGEHSPEDAADSAARRVCLDWLSWAGQLGDAPARLVVVGDDPDAWGERISAGWRSLEWRGVDALDAAALTLERLSGERPDPASATGARGLTSLSRRPTRAARARYRLVALALLCLLIALGSVAFRLNRKADGWRDRADVVLGEARAAAAAGWPAAGRPTGNLVRWADTQYEIELNQGPAFQPPPEPEQVFAEYQRVAEILADHAERETIRLESLTISQEQGSNTLTFRVEERETGTSIRLGLQSEDAYLDWQLKSRRTSPLRPTYSGLWRNLQDDGGSR